MIPFLDELVRLLQRIIGTRRKAEPKPVPRPSVPDARNETNVEAIIRAECRKWGVRPQLALAHAWVESRLDPDAVNPADPSFGAMQILCKADSPNAPCRNRLPAIPDFQRATQSRLLSEPRFNASIGVQLIAANLRQFGDEDVAIVAYNNYSAAISRDFTRNARGTGPGNYLDRVRAAERRFAAS